MLRLRGIIYLVITSFFIWHEFGDKTGNEWMPKIEDWASQNPTLNAVISVALFIFWVVIIIYWVKGLNLTFISGGLTEEQYAETPLGNVVWGGRSFASYNSELSNSGSKSNIDRLKEYRESKMSTMTKEQRADEYRRTALIDGLESNSTKNANGAREYINSKLSAMDNETAYKWLKNQK
jgi:hypothetical protein